MSEKVIVIKEKLCKRCGYKWIPRQEGEPIHCPKCRSAYWNIDRIRPVKKDETE